MVKQSYHNTTRERGQMLLDFTRKAQAQDQKILDFLAKNQDKWFTPFQIYDAIFNDNTPITSIRRSLTNLTEQHGKAEKSKEKVMERMGRPNYQWKYNSVK